MKTDNLERLARIWGIPENLATDMPRITMNANYEIYIESHKGIVSFEKNDVILAYKGGAIDIMGDKLEIAYITPDAVLIKGGIKSVEFKSLG